MYPAVLQSVEAPHAVETFSSSWQVHSERKGNVHVWSREVKEYSVGRKGFKKLVAEQYPSDELCAEEVNARFLEDFCATRPVVDSPEAAATVLKEGWSLRDKMVCSELFKPGVSHPDGWCYHELTDRALARQATSAKMKPSWIKGFHSSRWTGVHRILCTGLRESEDGPGGPGIYFFRDRFRTFSYNRYQLFEDGCCYCVVFEICTDPTDTRRVVKRKTANDHQMINSEGTVVILGVWTRGFTRAQIEKFSAPDCAECPHLSTVLSQWRPELEADVLVAVGKPDRLQSSHTSPTI